MMYFELKEYVFMYKTNQGLFILEVTGLASSYNTLHAMDNVSIARARDLEMSRIKMRLVVQMPYCHPPPQPQAGAALTVALVQADCASENKMLPFTLSIKYLINTKFS